MDKIEEFFHYISPKIIQLTNRRFEKTKEIKYKDKEYSPNFATEGDFDNEKLILEELDKWFPEDLIVAEETSPDSQGINKARSWIIDPICGSSNFKNGIKFFCTNIALSDKGKLIASCVVDHCREEYAWSVGDYKIYINRKEIKPEKISMGTIVDVDLSALAGQDLKRIERHQKLISFLLRDKRYYLSTFSTSLSFAYVGLGRIDAYTNGYSKIWDVAAANFLILQAGGVVTQLDGKAWDLFSDNVLAARDKKLHSELLKILNSQGPTK